MYNSSAEINEALDSIKNDPHLEFGELFKVHNSILALPESEMSERFTAFLKNFEELREGVGEEWLGDCTLFDGYPRAFDMLEELAFDRLDDIKFVFDHEAMAEEEIDFRGGMEIVEDSRGCRWFLFGEDVSDDMSDERIAECGFSSENELRAYSEECQDELLEIAAKEQSIEGVTFLHQFVDYKELQIYIDNHYVSGCIEGRPVYYWGV